ncbi:MAG: hypothetical protein WBD40_10360 [Tepidisphaeraceae bacterium]
MALLLSATSVHAQTAPTTTPTPALAPAVIEGRWLRPADGAAPAEPVWGHADGLRIGLSPLRGPRGLLRVYAPYLKHPPQRVINFIAIEPIRAGQSNRGLSELEHSKLDGVRGKRFWSADQPDDATPRIPTQPARGVIERVDGVETLRVYVLAERFDSGAQVYVRLTFRAGRPHEVAVATFSQEGSAPLASCVVTATMGNYARVRRLHLAERTVVSKDLWPDYRSDGFTPHARFELKELMRTPEGHAIASVTPDEPNPSEASYAWTTRKNWHYAGDVATQFWRCESPDERLAVLVNGRFTYWSSRSPIPGGVSFENFEMVAPFRQGGEFVFGVEPGTVASGR